MIPDVEPILGYAALGAGVCVIALGGWMIWGGRESREERRRRERVEELTGLAPITGEREPGAWARACAWRDGLTVPTRLLIGVWMLVFGYHAAAWGRPRWGLAEVVPPQRWWVLTGVMGITLAGSHAMDRWDEREPTTPA